MIDNKQIQCDKTQLVLSEVQRLTEKFNKEFLDCNNLMQILGVGRDNVRVLMRSEGFPTTTLGNRKIVSVLSFIIWQMQTTA